MLSPITYINDCIEELHHVRWPTRQQAVRLSVVVLGFTLVTAIVFGVVDFLLAKTVSIILPLA